MKIISIKPGFEFRENGTLLKAEQKKDGCVGCHFAENGIPCSNIPCHIGPKQKHDLIFTETSNHGFDEKKIGDGKKPILGKSQSLNSSDVAYILNASRKE